MHVSKMRSASLPVPHASSGLTAGSPGSRTCARRPRVTSEIDANRTPTCSAASMRWARSPPESWIEARPPGPARRPATSSSSVSAISSIDRTASTPCASNTASNAPASPARAPECAATISCAAGAFPTFRATTGMSRSAAATSTRRKSSGRRTASMNNATAFVLSSERA